MNEDNKSIKTNEGKLILDLTNYLFIMKECKIGKMVIKLHRFQ